MVSMDTSCLSLESNPVNMLVCLRCWLSDSLAINRLCYLLFLTKFLGRQNNRKMSHFWSIQVRKNSFLIGIND